jgi:IS5 family transposase
MVPFVSFRPKPHAALIKGELRRSEPERKNSAGRKPWDEVVIFKALVLQALCNLSGDQAEYQLRDRLSFMRFLGLENEDAVHARTTRRSRKAKRWKTGNPSRPKTTRKTRTRAGRRNRIGVDRRHKFVRRYGVSDARVHDSQKFEDIHDTSDTASGVWAKRAKGSVKRSLMEWRAGRLFLSQR